MKTTTRFISIFFFVAATLPSVAQRNAVSHAGQTSPTPASVLKLFGTPSPYSSGGSGAYTQATADENGDGKLDLLVLNSCGSTCNNGVLGVLLGNGDGTFRPALTNNLLGYGPTSVAVADVNHDGKPDVVVASGCASVSDCSHGEVEILLGNGDGTFRSSIGYSTAEKSATSVAIGDFNRDGKPDLIVSNACSTVTVCAAGVAVLLGNGDGTFQTALTTSSAGLGNVSIAVADLNGDGMLDAVVASDCEMAPPSCTVGIVSTLLGKGDGTFLAAVAYPASGTHPTSLKIDDANGDGKPDVLVGACYGSNCISGSVGVLLGNGDGTLKPYVLNHVVGGHRTQAFGTGDFNGDGKLDVVALSCSQNGSFCQTQPELFALQGNGDGSFAFPAPRFYAAGGNSFLGAGDIAVGDFNRDGRPDVVIANNGLWVLLNIAQVPTMTTLASSLNPSHVTQSVTFTATVTGLYAGKTTGLVTFKQGSTVLGTAAVVSGQATLAHIFTNTGTFPIKAFFAGDANNKGSSSGTLSQVVTP